jgi:hypothetical protein
MTDIRKNIKQHYSTVIGGEMKKMTVEEWDCDIYYRQTNSFKDEAKMISLQAKGEIVEALVQSIISKARNKDGSKMFQEADRSMLLNEADPKVLTRIATTLNNAQVNLEQAEAAKESEPTQS